MLSLILATAAFAPQGPGTSTAPVVINEFVYDDSGADDFEFVELYNRSGATVDISLWQIVCNDPGSPPLGSGAVPTHVIPAGTLLAAGQFYLLGSALVVPTPVPGVSQQWANNALENGSPDTVELQDFSGLVIDEVTYEMGGQTSWTLGAYTYPGEGGLNGDGSVGNGPAASAARVLDGYDNDDNGRDFLVTWMPTPGASNILPSAVPYLDIFDTGAVGGDVLGWTGGWVKPKYVDPTVIDSQNLNARPPSPQGGLAMSTWDSGGGGNTVVLDTTPMSDVVVETFAYFEPTMAPLNPAPYSPLPAAILDTYNMADGEWWCVGVRGSLTPNGNPPDAGTYWADISPGVGTRYHHISGICWAHFRTPYYSRLYLLDCGTGPNFAAPNNHTILAGPIDILPGVNDGWQRIRLHVQGDRVVANFGGGYGFDDGQRFSVTTTTTDPGSVYIGYREALLYNNNGLAGCHPPHFDVFDVHAPTTTKLFFGAASPTNTGTPGIDADGFAIPGTTAFAIQGSGMVPGSGCLLQQGFASVGAGFAVPGAPATALLYVLPPPLNRFGFADGSGNVAFPTSLPPNNAFLGVPIFSQIVNLDVTMAFAVPIGTTQGMQTRVGN